jgi:HD-like signal output (HDOD) protein/CheY-like chemotaxis protein
MSKRILFVDDEAMVLQGIQRSLRCMRAEWETEFATSAAEALEIMSRAPFDVVITDMRMPVMDGAHFLELVKTKFPRTVRMILSGQSDRESILRSIGPTHQYLSKPCDVEELKQKLLHAFALRDLLADPHLKEVVSRLNTVPSLPATYVAITKALQAPDASISEIGGIIAADMGMSSKLLQIVNSAFFGMASPVSNVKQAAALIGMENIRALALSVNVFSRFEGSLGDDMAFLWNHSLATAGFAKAITRAQKGSQTEVDNTFTAGLLHDVGRLILASACAKDYRLAIVKANQGAAMLAAEQEVFGCTHAAVGAYLLGLWGLPDVIVAAAAWHHDPAAGGAQSFSSLIAVHVANHYDHELHSYPPPGANPLVDETLLAKLGLLDRLPAWAQACQETAPLGETNHV